MFKATQSPFSSKGFNSLGCGLLSFSLKDGLLKIFFSGMFLSSSVGLSFVIILTCLYSNANLAGSMEIHVSYVYFEL